MLKKNYQTEIVEMPKNINTYLGQKGYTIPKNELTIKQQYYIKEELMVKPFVMGSPTQNQKVFPVYRESDKKIYVPRYYGEKILGKAKLNKLNEGDNISLNFNGILRDYQTPVVEKFLSYVKNEESNGLLELPCAWGKTSASLYITSQLKKKTIVIVHKEFLMNQWIERIQQFLPDARIGKIQGQIIDVENKDIVLCMLQSLVLKDYPSSIFDSFGFTIIDEVHHISSETFSNALFKIVTKYMLGLSATMNRKDGTTKVFKMFLGDVVHKVEKANDHEVEVRSIHYRVDDDEFNSDILDYKGQPQISSMISKLCTYNRRTEFIIKTLTDFICVDNVDKEVILEHKKVMDSCNPICEICLNSNNYLLKNTCCDSVKYCLNCLDNIISVNKTKKEIKIDKKTGEEKGVKRRPKCPNCKKVLEFEQNYIENPYIKPIHIQQTIILSHNLNVLEYIYRKMICKNIASVGYYVGGMSEQELKKSEKQQVILASFQMASEGLDIPGLTSEFLITPKTDIIQSVGRILRSKHAVTKPVIYDFIDSHGVFQKQWLKRKKFYKSQNYKIIQTNNTNYTPDTSKWQTILSPKSTPTSCREESSDDSNISDCEEENTSNPKDKLSGTCLLKFKK